MSAIIYSRISVLNDSRTTSLESQEDANMMFMKKNKLKLFKCFKDVGSAFSKPQKDLKTFLSSCKNKTLIVFDVSRLTRNTVNFKHIYDICKKNKHSIGVTSLDYIFHINNISNYEILFKLVLQTQQESIDIGNRIRRAYRFKKKNELQYGKKRDENGVVIDVEYEVNVMKLIYLLSTKHSPIDEIRRLITLCGNMTGKDYFDVVEIEDVPYLHNRSRMTDLNVDFLPYEMYVKNIIETLRYYEIRKRTRGLNWTVNDIRDIYKIYLSNDKKREESKVESKEIDDLCVRMKTNVKTDMKWMYVWYDPAIGLPSDIIVPVGMSLPTSASMIYLPQKQ